MNRPSIPIPLPHNVPIRLGGRVWMPSITLHRTISRGNRGIQPGDTIEPAKCGSREKPGVLHQKGRSTGEEIGVAHGAGRSIEEPKVRIWSRPFAPGVPG